MIRIFNLFCKLKEIKSQIRNGLTRQSAVYTFQTMPVRTVAQKEAWFLMTVIPGI